MGKAKLAVVIQKYGLVGGAERCAAFLTDHLADLGEYEIHLFANKWIPSRNQDIIYHKVPIITFPRFLRPLSFAAAVENALGKFQFDLIHSHDRTYAQDIVTVHGTCHEYWIKEVRKKRFSFFDRATIKVEKRQFRENNYKKIIALSAKTKNELMEYHNIPRENIEIIPNGVDLKVFNREKRRLYRKEIRQKYNLSEKHKVILFIAMNFGLKGLQSLFEGFSGIDEKERKEKNLKIMVVGKGKANLHDSIKKDVLFVGVVRDIEKYYCAADMFVLPSQNETFGSTVLEAMACGAPVIVSSCAGAAELVRNGENGLILQDPCSAKEIREKIGLMLDEEKRLPFEQKAAETARKYDWQKIAARVAVVYDDILRLKS